MGKIIDSDPAPYPATNVPEFKAVSTFCDIVDPESTKPDIKVLDKFPNTDGTVEIVTDSQIPIGKLDVQVKILEKKNYVDPKYQCSKPFLAACEQSILPVLLIVVNTETRVAYWHHMDHVTLKELSKKLKKESVSFKFNKDNSISSGDNRYVGKWIEIIKAYQFKLYDYDLIQKRHQQLQEEHSRVSGLVNTAVGKTNPIFKEVHKFLDFYNGLLDIQFLTVKNLLYPNYWKIGFGLHRYETDTVSFSLYPIAYDYNEALIKQFSSSEDLFAQNFLQVSSHSSDNPIKREPRECAYKLIQDDLKRVFKRQTFLVKDQFLANEYILAFIDKFYLILGLEPEKSKYSISEVQFALTTFLGFFLEQFAPSGMTEEQLRRTSFNIDPSPFHRSREIHKETAEKVQKLIKEGGRPHRTYKFHSEEFDVQNLFVLLDYTEQLGTNDIEREYESKQAVNKQVYGVWEAWGEKKSLSNIRVFYDNFIRIYDKVVSTYFPELFGDLRFFCDFNLLIIVADFSKKENGFNPTIEYYYLKTDNKPEGRILIYNSLDADIPVPRNDFRALFSNEIEIDSEIFKVTRSSWGELKFIYNKTPVLTSIHKLLEERLNKYLDEKRGRS